MRNARTGIRLDAMTATCAMRKSQSAAHWRMTMDDILDRLKAACIGQLDDERGWNFKRREQFDRIGKALESRRLRRETGEPARSDADEVESLIAELGKAERERDEARAAIRDALEVGCVIGTAETVLRAALGEG